MSHFPIIHSMLADLLPATTTATESADSVLAPYVYVFYAAFLVAFFFTPIMRQIAMYYGIVDEPDLKRKLHGVPIAYLGGVSVFLGWLAGLAISQFLTVHRADSDLTHLNIKTPVIAAAVIVVALGLFDDIKKAPPWTKIAVQVIAAIVLLFGGIGIHSTEPLLSPVLLRLHNYYGWNHDYDKIVYMLTGAPLTIAVVVACCNATNLMDGLDGQCSGVTGIITIGFVFLAVHMATFGKTEDANADGMRVVLCLSLLGGLLGFLPYNFNPASIFLGDAGSMFIGFSCAAIMIMMAENQPKWFLAAVVMFAIPIMDTSLAFARRWVNGRPLFSADRHHFHHQLVARGFSVKQTALISYGLAICFVLLGAVIVFIRTRYAVACYLVIFGFIVVAAYKMGMVHEKARAVVRQPLAGNMELSKTELEPGSVLEVLDGNGKLSANNGPTPRITSPVPGTKLIDVG